MLTRFGMSDSNTVKKFQWYWEQSFLKNERGTKGNEILFKQLIESLMNLIVTRSNFM